MDLDCTYAEDIPVGSMDILAGRNCKQLVMKHLNFVLYGRHSWPLASFDFINISTLKFNSIAMHNVNDSTYQNCHFWTFHLD